MSKPPTIASLVRTATHSEKQYVENTTAMFLAADHERTKEYFSRLSMPRVWAVEEPAEFPPEALETIYDFAVEYDLMAGQTKFIERNIRKIKWHISHPSLEGSDSIALIFGIQANYACMRIRRVVELLKASETLTAQEWGTARELLNRCYRDYRQTVELISNRWLEVLLESVPRDQALASLEGYPQMIRKASAELEGLRDVVEAVRLQGGVKPEGYPLVKPPRYFGGDLLDPDSWKHFWSEVATSTEALKQQVGLGI
jgi:hypothetical protein